MITRKKVESVLMHRLYESVIYPGKCIHLKKVERERLRSVWAYDITYLYPAMHKDMSWMKFGLFGSNKNGRKIPFYNVQQERFLQLMEECQWIEQIVEYPEEIIYCQDFTLTFAPDYMVILNDGCAFMVMLMPYHLFSTQEAQKKWYAMVQYCKEHGFGCVMFDIEKGISLKWVLDLWKNKDMAMFEKEVLKAMHTKKSHWLDGCTLHKIMDKHHANLCDMQTLVFKNKLLYVPRNSQRKVSLVKAHEKNMFDSQLIIDIYENHHHTRRNCVQAHSRI